MDVVIPLGTGSRWKDNELRYALRSIEKHLKGYDKVFIVGECPSWLQNVIHIPAADTPGRKEYSIFSKIMKAVEDERCSDQFVFSNDDIFFLKDIQVNEIKYWYEGTLAEKHAKTHGHYKAAISNTIDKCDWFNLNDFYFDIHTPIVYGKICIERLNEFDWSKEYVIKSLYGNSFAPQYDFMTDLKINAALKYEQIKAKIADRLFFSIGSYGVCPAMTKVLTELFPDKSKYEK